MNVASRIESLGVQGSVLISDKVFDEIKNQSDIKTESLGFFELKNIDRSIEVFAISNEGFHVPRREEIKGKIKTPAESGKELSVPGKNSGKVMKFGLFALGVLLIVYFLYEASSYSGFFSNSTKSNEIIKNLSEKSIAVLPFKNMSGDPDQEYLCDGLTDEIINHLFKIESFDKVVSLSSVLTYKATSKRLPEIADELKVNYILEGTYKNVGDQIRISAQLIEPKKDKHLWTNDYDQPVEKIFVIQSDIALQIARNLQAFLTTTETQNIQAIPTLNQEAYQLAQKATLAFEQGEWTHAEDYLNQAIELDPNFADVHAGLGLLKLWASGYGGQTEKKAAVWEAKSSLEKALELNPNIGSGHFGMALLNDWVQWDFIKAEKEYLKAIALEPNNAGYIRIYVEFLLKMNRLEDALIYINQLYKKVITAPDYRLWSYILHKIGKTNEAEEKINEGLELNGKQFFKYAGAAYIWKEEYESALIYLDSALKINEKEILYPWFQASLALAYYKTDNFQKAQEIINQTIDKSKITSAGSPARFTAWYYGAIGEVDSAFYYLEKAYENRSVQMPWLKVSPAFDDLRDDDRYWDLYERTGHKAYDAYMEKEGIRNSN